MVPCALDSENAIQYVNQKFENRLNMRKTKKKNKIAIKAKWMRELIRPIVLTILSQTLKEAEEREEACRDWFQVYKL